MERLNEEFGRVDGWPKAVKSKCCGPPPPIPPPPYPVTDEEEKEYRRACDLARLKSESVY